eukprot:14925038-Ditylum_brightwellii.AAC.1
MALVSMMAFVINSLNRSSPTGFPAIVYLSDLAKILSLAESAKEFLMQWNNCMEFVLGAIDCL